MQSRKSSFVVLPLLIGSLTALSPMLSQAADAQSDTPAAAAGDTPQAGQHRRHDPSAFVQKRLERLKSDLRITPEQQAQWSAFSNSVMQQMEQLKAAHQSMKERPAKAPERIDRQVEMMKQRLASFETIAQAAKTLYASLDPAQQQIADQRLLNFHHHRAG
jgi:periplasmic protein CpxP/Spy